VKKTSKIKDELHTSVIKGGFLMYIVSNYVNKFKYYIYEDLRATGYPE
jgi:hypothetical protein